MARHRNGKPCILCYKKPSVSYARVYNPPRHSRRRRRYTIQSGRGFKEVMKRGFQSIAKGIFHLLGLNK